MWLTSDAYIIFPFDSIALKNTTVNGDMLSALRTFN
jgi:hypothetical protein